MKPWGVSGAIHCARHASQSAGPPSPPPPHGCNGNETRGSFLSQPPLVSCGGPLLSEQDTWGMGWGALWVHCGSRRAKKKCMFFYLTCLIHTGRLSLACKTLSKTVHSFFTVILMKQAQPWINIWQFDIIIMDWFLPPQDWFKSNTQTGLMSALVYTHPCL